MCEFCGCGGAHTVVRRATKAKRGRPLDIRIVAVGSEPRAPAPGVNSASHTPVTKAHPSGKEPETITETPTDRKAL